jgi:hypothetical protein
MLSKLRRRFSRQGAASSQPGAAAERSDASGAAGAAGPLPQLSARSEPTPRSTPWCPEAAGPRDTTRSDGWYAGIGSSSRIVEAALPPVCAPTPEPVESLRSATSGNLAATPSGSTLASASSSSMSTETSGQIERLYAPTMTNGYRLPLRMVDERCR